MRLGIGDHVMVVDGRYATYEGRVVGGDAAKNYVTVNVWGIHCLRFAPDQLVSRGFADRLGRLR